MARLDVMSAVIAVMARRWEWGSADCCAAACDVFAAIHGIDPMARLRGAYATRDEAEAMIARHGGLEALAASLAAEAGLRASEGRAGDIGVSEAGAASGGRCLMICTGRGWAAKSPTGFALLPRAARAWSA